MGGLWGSGVLGVWLDIDPSVQQEADAWYVDEHLPERVTIAGFNRARRYEALEGTPRYLSLFEADTPDALASEGYFRVVAKVSETSHRVRRAFGEISRMTFEVVTSASKGDGGCLATIRFEPTHTAEILMTDGALAETATALTRGTGVIGVHVLEAAPRVRQRMDAVRETGHADEGAGCVLMIETDRSESLRAATGAALGQLPKALSSRARTGLYRLMFSVDGRTAVAA